MGLWRQRLAGLGVGVGVVVVLGIVESDTEPPVEVDCEQLRDVWGDEPDGLLGERLRDVGC